MIQQQGQALTFYAFYTASKMGVTGLTVTCDVFEGTTQAPIVTAGNASELADGLYYYTLAGAAVDANACYLCVFKTTDATVDAQHVPALWAVPAWVANVDASITAVPAAVWGYTARTLTGFGTLVADIWAAATRTLTSLPAAYVAAQVATATANGLTIYAAMTRPVLNVTLTSGGVAVDVTAATAVKLYVRNLNSATRIINGATMTKTDAANGLVAYTLSATETALAGVYQAQVEVTYADGGLQRFGGITITIAEAV